MKNKLNLIGAFVALALFSGCGKNEQTVTLGAAPSTSSGGSGEVSLRNIYVFPLNGGSYLVTEMQNTGNAPIKAWKGKWTIKDDLDEVVSDETISYTSDTPYLPSGTAHVIAPGEKFMIIDQAVTGEADKEFCAAATNLTNCGLPLTMVLQQSKLDDYKVTKKIVFEVEKVVSP